MMPGHNPVNQGTRQPLGLSAFESLRAEDEPWLAEWAYVPPPDFELMAGARSIAVYGQSGAGKSALRCALEHRATFSTPRRLIAHWRPSLSADMPVAGTPAARAQLAHAMDACATALLEHLACSPEAYGQAPTWAQQVLVWFIRHFVNDLDVRAGPLMRRVDSAGQVMLEALVSQPARNVLAADAPIDTIVARLVEALDTMGISGVWIMADGLEGWAESEPDRLTAALSAFLSTLPLFECSQFAYKLLIPSSLESALVSANGPSRRRIDGYRLHWDSASLQRLVERRLALALGQDHFTLQDLCNAPGLLQWLERAGGTSPREWLSQVRPLILHYHSHRLTQPVDSAVWEDLRRKHPPRLYLDEMRRCILVGGRQVSLEDVPSKAYEMLTYLYQHSDQIVTKAALYFRVYRGLDEIPRSPDNVNYESPKEYEGVIDTNLWRLRKAIEPDPDDPVLLVTVKGHGIRLETRW